MPLDSFTRSLRQTATYWPKAGVDSFSRALVSEPVLISCRWQDKSDLFLGSDRKQLVSSSIVYCLVQVEVDGFLALGNHLDISNPKALASSKIIMSVNQSPALDIAYSVIKVYL